MYSYADLCRALNECMRHPKNEWKLAVLQVVAEGFMPAGSDEYDTLCCAAEWMEDHE